MLATPEGGARPLKEGYEVVVVREVLEGMLSTEIAASVLFAALDSVEREPVGPAEWSGFAGGPLRDQLVLRVGEELADQVSQRVRGILGTPPPPRMRRSEAPTAPFPTGAGPTRVLVLATSGRLARRLKVALGPSIVPLGLSDLSRLETLASEFRPMLVLVDLTDPPDPLGTLVGRLARLDPAVITILFDEGTPLGKGMAGTLEEAGRRVTLVDRREDVGPLMDLVRAVRRDPI
ncbi:MAG: hypothetical protein KF901_14810 [Myxococcales bacterium]|nr:hypothetical protein [Myxococcales bacterium]